MSQKGDEAMRPNQNQPEGRLDLLDRAWAATRPELPDPSAFDRIWAGVTAEVERPEVVVIPFARPKTWIMAMAAVAQAAALVIGGFVALRAPAPNLVAVAPRASATVSECVGAEGSTLFVSLDKRGAIPVVVELRPETPVSETDMVAAESDVLGAMETLGQGTVE